MTIVKPFIPPIILKPKDLWGTPRALVKIAQLRGSHDCVSTLNVAVHYVWKTPTRATLARLRPKWGRATTDRWLAKFKRHEALWGPGDVEFVKLIVRCDVYPEWYLSEIRHRTGANMKNCIARLFNCEWDKVGNDIVYSYGHWQEPPALVIDSFHHSFYELGEVPEDKRGELFRPKIAYFSDEEWEHYQVVRRQRSYEEWEA